MNKIIVFLLTSFSLNAACIFTIDGNDYFAQVRPREVTVNTKSIKMVFERDKSLESGILERHYLSSMVAQLTEDYPNMASEIGLDFGDVMEMFNSYAMELIHEDENSDLIDENYRLHSYFRTDTEVTMVFYKSDDHGIMFAEIKAQCR